MNSSTESPANSMSPSARQEKWYPAQKKINQSQTRPGTGRNGFCTTYIKPDLQTEVTLM